MLVLPPPEEKGMVVLNETSVNVTTKALIVLVMFIVAGLCLIYWWNYFVTGLPGWLAAAPMAVLAFFGLLSVVFLPDYIFELIYPESLIVDESGLQLREKGKKRKVSWAEVRTIGTHEREWSRLLRLVAGEEMAPVLCITVRGMTTKLTWDPIFDVSADALAGYLKARWELTKKVG